MDNHTPPPPDDTPAHGVPSNGTPSDNQPFDTAPDASLGASPEEPYSASFEASQINGPESGLATDRAAEIAARGGFRLGAPGGAISRSAMGSTLSDEDAALVDDYTASLQPTAAQTLERDEANEEPALADALESPNDFYAVQVPEPELAAIAAVDNRDKELDLIEHLRELRSRILFCFGAVFVAMCVTWYFGKGIQEFLVAPISSTLKAHGIHHDPSTPQFNPALITTDPIDGFSIYFQVTLAAALLACAPILIYQLWAFIEPALTKSERRYIGILVPFSTVLFVVGAALGYVMSPVFFQFFLAFQPPGSVALWSYLNSITLLAKMMLVFGVCFQTPVITIFLMKTNIVGRNILLEYWRHAVVVIFIIVAVITPTWDPITLTACAVPPCLLYGLSLWMVKWL